MTDYPKRNSYFAHKAVRLMIRTCAAQEIGSDAFLLVTVIAHTEDAKRYTAPVTFWNAQLESVLGFSWGKLDRARKRAVAAGWLHYEAGGKARVGRYWVTIPPSLQGIAASAVDEDHPVLVSTGEEENVGQTDFDHVSLSTGEETSVGHPGDIRGASADQSVINPGDKCGSFLPTPKPVPKKARARFRPPTIEEVTVYCTDRAALGKPAVDPQTWYDHYTANGWMVGRNKMKDWKAAVRTWERNEFRKGGHDAGTNRPSGRHHQAVVGKRPEATV
jgi:hypothetical protein